MKNKLILKMVITCIGIVILVGLLLAVIFTQLKVDTTEVEQYNEQLQQTSSCTLHNEAPMATDSLPHVTLKTETPITSPPEPSPIMTPDPTIEPSPIMTPDPTIEPTPEPFYYDIPLDEETQDFIVSRMELFNIQLDPAFIYSLIYCESTYQMAVESSSGAVGYMQVMPGTFNYLRPMLLEEYPDIEGVTEDMWDERTNITMGLYCIRYTADEKGHDAVTEDNFHQILTCYNRGIGGGNTYYSNNGTWESGYSKKVFRIAEQIKADGGIQVY